MSPHVINASSASGFAAGVYQQTLDPNTLTRQQGDLALFSLYLADAGIEVSAVDLFSDPTAWAGMTHGLLTGFVQWMLLDGYAIGSINVRLTTVRVYAKLAGKAPRDPQPRMARCRKPSPRRPS